MRIEHIRESIQLFQWMIENRNNDFIFRGQTDAKPLRPGIGREKNQATRRGGGRAPHSPEQERAALEDFRRRCVTLVHPRVATALDWLTLAQHYGMPTRLLDWTASFLVAAHFAVKSVGIANGEPKDGVIFVLPRTPLAEEAETHDPFSATRDFIHLPPTFDARISAQKSVFTVHHNPEGDFDPEGLVRLDISSDICSELKQVLLSHALDNSMIYPDIGGIAEHCGYKYKWREYPAPR